MSEKLFAYGTLMFPEIRDVIAGREFKTIPAVLHGYRRAAISIGRRAAVPAIVTDESASVSGLIVLGVDRKILSAFDLFEGVKNGLYTREAVKVISEKGESITVHTYVAGPAVREILQGEWDPETFQKRQLTAYRRQVIAAWRE